MANKFIKTDRQDLGGDFYSNGFDENRSNFTFIVTIFPAAYKDVMCPRYVSEFLSHFIICFCTFVQRQNVDWRSINAI